MYNISGGEISLYTVEKDNENATLINNGYYYFKDIDKNKILLYTSTVNNTYKLAQNGYYKLTNTNTSDTNLSNNLYNITTNGELTEITNTYNLICVNTNNIYMSNGTKKTVQNNTMYICDSKILLNINNIYSYIP
jgi:hypothetical protein